MKKAGLNPAGHKQKRGIKMGLKLQQYLDGGWQLWSSRGTLEVSIRKKDSEEIIDIPSSILRRLVADDIISEKISRLEQMETDDVLTLLI